MATVLLIRHCEATAQEPDAPLTALGRQQADALADRLCDEPIDLIISSPFTRARESVAPLAARRNLRIETDVRLAEHNLSSQAIPDWLDFVRRSFTHPAERAPGGDSADETLLRGMAAFTDVLARNHVLPVIVAHGLILSLMIHSIQPDFGFEGWESMRNPDIFAVRLVDSVWSVERRVP